MRFVIEKEKSDSNLVFSIIPDEDVYYYNLEFHFVINEILIKLEKYDLLENKTVTENYSSLENLKSAKLEKPLKNIILEIIKKYSMVAIE